MAVRYDVYESPQTGKEEKAPKLHARLITDGTITTDELAEKIQYSSSLTVGDVKAVLSTLGYLMGDLLGIGKRIHIEGLGYFQMTLECDPAPFGQKVRADYVHFKSVAFRPEASLKKELSKTKFVRAPRKKHSSNISDEEIKELLQEHFLESSYITRAQFQRLCDLTEATALRRLKSLLTKGVLRKEGAKNFPIYFMNETDHNEE